MAEIIKFPGRFKQPDEEDKKKAESEKIDEPETPIEEVDAGEEKKPPVLSPEKRQEISDVLGAFHERMEGIRNSNPNILWSGNKAREMAQIVRTYTPHELVTWIWDVDDRTILQKPLFFSAISYELIRRGFVPDKKKEPEGDK